MVAVEDGGAVAFCSYSARRAVLVVPLAHVWLRARDLQMVLFLRVFELDEWPCGGSDRSRVRNF